MRTARHIGPPTITVREALGLPALQQVKVIAGRRGLSRQIRWVHIVDIPEIAPWLNGGELLLTTGYGWPKKPDVQRETLRVLNQLSLAGILFETGKFIKDIPAIIRHEANRLGLPILQAPYEVRFVDITEEVHRAIMGRQYARLAQFEQIHRTLTQVTVQAEDLQEIANALAELIGSSVTIEDAEFRLLAYANVGESSDTVRAATIRQARTPVKVVRELEARGVLRDLSHAQGSVRVPAIPEVAMGPRVVCPIRTATDIVGYVWILEGSNPLSELDMWAAEEIAALAALHILRQQAAASAEDRVRFTFVDALIRGESARSRGLDERARLLGFDPDEDYAVSVLTIAPDVHRGRRWPLGGRYDFELRERYRGVLRAALEGISLHQFMTFQLNQIVFFVPSHGDTKSLKDNMHQIWTAIAAQDASIPLILTVGGTHKGAEGIARSYREADTLVGIVVPPLGIHFYEEYVFAQLLLNASVGVLRQLQMDTTAKLGNPQNEKAARETLLALLRNRFNLQATARALALHRNTVRQRLATIVQDTGAPLSDERFWAQLILVAEAERYGLLNGDTFLSNERPLASRRDSERKPR